MTLGKLLALTYLLIRRVLLRAHMLLVRPAFSRYGRNFLFDPGDLFTHRNIEVGDDVSIGSGAVFLATESRIRIGNKVLFGPNVSIIGGNHNTSRVGRFLYDVRDKRPEDDEDVAIEDDVWVGCGAIILKGAKVGRGSVIAAGALVNKDVLPYTVVGGVPARVIGVRFGDLETLRAHDAALYRPELRLDDVVLKMVLDHAREAA